MIRYWQVITLTLVVLCWCASRPAFSQTRAAQPSAKPTSQTQETARLRDKLAEQSERLSRVEGRLDAVGEATTRAADAGKEAAKSSQDVITTLGECTKLITILVTAIGLVLGVFGYKQWQSIQAVKEKAEDALRQAEETARKADEAVKTASACAETAAQLLREVQQSEQGVREVHERVERLRREIADKRDQANADAEEIAKLREQVNEGAKVDPTKPVSAAEKKTLRKASRASERLKDLGQALTPQAYLVRGNAHFFRGEYESALKEYDQALSLRSDYASAHDNRGAALVRLGRYDEALDVFDRALELTPDSANACYNRACVYSRLGRKDEALRDLSRAIESSATWQAAARKDDDFANLRDDPEFRKLVGLEENSS